MTKEQELKEGSTGCLAKAEPDEMLFILRAQDVTAPHTIIQWINYNFDSCPDDKLREAFECALKMKSHPYKKRPD